MSWTPEPNDDSLLTQVVFGERMHLILWLIPGLPGPTRSSLKAENRLTEICLRWSILSKIEVGQCFPWNRIAHYRGPQTPRVHQYLYPDPVRGIQSMNPSQIVPGTRVRSTNTTVSQTYWNWMLPSWHLLDRWPK